MHAGRLTRFLIGLGITGGALAYAASLPPPASASRTQAPPLPALPALPRVHIDQPPTTLLGREERLMAW